MYACMYVCMCRNIQEQQPMCISCVSACSDVSTMPTHVRHSYDMLWAQKEGSSLSSAPSEPSATSAPAIAEEPDAKGFG